MEISPGVAVRARRLDSLAHLFLDPEVLEAFVYGHLGLCLALLLDDGLCDLLCGRIRHDRVGLFLTVFALLLVLVLT